MDIDAAVAASVVSAKQSNVVAITLAAQPHSYAAPAAPAPAPAPAWLISAACRQANSPNGSPHMPPVLLLLLLLHLTASTGNLAEGRKDS